MRRIDKSRLFRGVDPRPIRLDRCFDPRCKALIPPWRTACWKHEQEMAAEWPEVWAVES